MEMSFTTSIATLADIKPMADLLQLLLAQESEFSPNKKLQESWLTINTCK